MGAHLEAPSVRMAHLKLKQGRAINDESTSSLLQHGGMRAADTTAFGFSRVVGEDSTG